ncbi:TetR/AcrR family transcriptional regulator [Nocardia nova]|uniref:TetR/AcrR family transcriptional regulator n=1 Tax=Nocardia nova TaxID=37330 RepID=UPI003714924E
MASAPTSYTELLDPAGAEPTIGRILDAALELFAEVGVSRTGIDDIARRAKMNRATVYRRVGAKDAIVRAAVLRETSRILDRIAARLRAIDDPHRRIIDGFAITVTELRANPILRKILAVDREHTLAAITVDAAESLSLATDFVAREILAVRAVDVGGDAVGTTAALIVRLIHSVVLVPEAPPHMQTETALREFAADYLVPLIRPAGPETPH